MAKDLHEQILLYLFEFRNDSKYHDIFEHFKQEDHEAIYDRYHHLQNDHLVEAEPETKFTSTISTKELDFFGVKNYKYSLRLRITIPKGIDYVKDKVKPRIYQIDNWSKIVSMGGVIFAIVFGLIAYVQDTKYKEEQQLNFKLKADKDSINEKLNATKTYYENLLKKKDQQNQELNQKLDSIQIAPKRLKK